MSRAGELMPFSTKQLEGVLIIKSTIITAFLAKKSCYINNPISAWFWSSVFKSERSWIKIMTTKLAFRPTRVIQTGNMERNYSYLYIYHHVLNYFKFGTFAFLKFRVLLIFNFSTTPPFWGWHLPLLHLSSTARKRQIWPKYWWVSSIFQ